MFSCSERVVLVVYEVSSEQRTVLYTAYYISVHYSTAVGAFHFTCFSLFSVHYLAYGVSKCRFYGSREP